MHVYVSHIVSGVWTGGLNNECGREMAKALNVLALQTTRLCEASVRQ